MKRLKIFLVMLSVATLLLQCAEHSYTIKTNQKAAETHTEMVAYTLAWFVPATRTVDAYEICPAAKVHEVSIYDSGLDGAICAVTVFLYCPKTIKVSCHE